MRRTLIAVLLLIPLSLPVCAQRWSTTARGGERMGFRISGGNFRSWTGVRGGVDFGHNPRWQAIIQSRPHWGYRPFRRPYYRPYNPYYSYPYVFTPTYVYPYVVAPAYPAPVNTYQGYDYVVATPQPAYPYVPAEQVGLDTQMREEHVGIYRGYGQSQPQPPEAPVTSPQPSATIKQPVPRQAAPPPQQPPTTLVYRDGHSVEVRNYAIVGQTVWIFNEQRAQKVPLADLDLNATAKANEERGIEFALPPAPTSH